jgi:hypothetical protein
LKNFGYWLLIVGGIALALGGVGWLGERIFQWHSIVGALGAMVVVLGIGFWLAVEDNDLSVLGLFIALAIAIGVIGAAGWYAFHFLHWTGIVVAAILCSLLLSLVFDLTKKPTAKPDASVNSPTASSDSKAT